MLSSEKILQQAFEKFEKSSKLPRWLNFKANKLNEECDETSKKYNFYKRGTIINVNFGVNIGSEYCGTHFAVVLNKKDNPYQRVLTVVPLTSKNHKSFVNLNFELFKLFYEYTERMIDDKKDLLNKVERYNKNTNCCVSSITTISKEKIIYDKNIFSPIGRVRICDKSLNKIDAKIKEFFIK